MSPAASEPKILPGLEAFLVPTEWVDSLPGNPRRGDVMAVVESLRAFGCHRPVVAWKQGTRAKHPYGVVIAGNHQLAAFRYLGWPKIPVVWTTDDATVAKARALADNRTHDLGEGYDDELLATMLSELPEAIFTATGWKPDDLEKLVAARAEKLTDAPIEDPVAHYRVIVECESLQGQDDLIAELTGRGMAATTVESPTRVARRRARQ